MIEAPIVVTGPARSGTTILFELLGLDPGVRTPIATDVLHPVVPAGTTDAERRAMTEAEQELWADVQPEFAAMHELRSDLPVECITICAPSFAGNHWAMVLTDHGRLGARRARPTSPSTAPSCRPSSTAGRPGGGCSRRPGYVFMLDDLLAAYPDASVIVSHRDPARTMPSTVSTTAMVQWLRTDDGRPRRAVRAHRGGVHRRPEHRWPAAATTGRCPACYGDVRFADLMADPVGRHRRAPTRRSAAR